MEPEVMGMPTGAEFQVAPRTPWALRTLCCCLYSDFKMRLDTWENTVLICSTMIHADHQTEAKSCWKALKLGNNIGSRAKPAVLFLRLRAPFQNYCLLFSSSLVFKRSPFNTKNYHDLGVNKSYFFKWWTTKCPMNWSTSCCHGVCHLHFYFFFHIPKYFTLLSPWNLEDLGFSLSQDSCCWPVHQTTCLLNSSHRRNTPPTKPKAPSSNHSPFWQPVPLIPLYPEQTINLLPWTLLATSSA